MWDRLKILDLTEEYPGLGSVVDVEVEVANIGGTGGHVGFLVRRRGKGRLRCLVSCSRFYFYAMLFVSGTYKWRLFPSCFAMVSELFLRLLKNTAR
jgi:hypothetical protein